MHFFLRLCTLVFLTFMLSTLHASTESLTAYLPGSDAKNNTEKDDSRKRTQSSAQKNQALIDMLEDPEKREAFLNNLKQLHDATKKDGLVRVDDTIIHDVNETLVQQVESWSHQLMRGVRTLAHFPGSIWESLKTLDSADIQANVLAFFIISLLTTAGAFFFEILTRKACARAPILRKPLTNWMQKSWVLILHIIPYFVFLLSIYMILGYVETPYTDVTITPVIENMMEDIFLIRFVLMLVRFYVQPVRAHLRFSAMSTLQAQKLYRFAVMFQSFVIFGISIYGVFTVLDVSKVARHTWQSIVGFGLAIFVSSVILEYRVIVARKIRRMHVQYKGLGLKYSFSNLSRFLARFWHLFAILSIFAFFLGWVYDYIADILWFFRALLSSSILYAGWHFAHARLRTLRKKWAHDEQQLKDCGTTVDVDMTDPLSLAKAMPLTQSAYFIMPLLQFLIAALAVVLCFEAWGVSFITFINTPQTQTYLLKLLSLVLIMGSIRVLWGLIDLIANSHMHPVSEKGRALQPSHFVQTITPIARSTAKVFIFIIGSLLLLSELNFDIMPILYAFGFLGFAIGLGAQTMAKDILTGFVTLLEGNIQVGEFVTIGQTSGTVEAITLRSVFLRHGNGSIESIPFSEVNHIVNKSRDYTLHIMGFPVSRSTSIAHVKSVLTDAFEEIQKSKEFGGMIRAPMTVGGVAQFSDTAIVINAYVRTIPDPKGLFMRAFQTVVQEHFKSAGICPPTQTQMYIKNGDSSHGPSARQTPV